MRTFTEQEAKELLCPMCFNNSSESPSLMCAGKRCVAFTESSERYDVQSGRDVLDFYCAAMPGNRK